MTTGNPTFDLILLSIAGFIVLLTVGFVIISQVTAARAVALLLVELPLVPVRALHEAMQVVTNWLVHVSADMFHRAIDTPPGEWVGKVFIGAVFYVVLVLLFLVPEVVLTLMALQGLGMVSADIVLPAEAGLLTAASFLAHGLFWGATFLDSAKGVFYHGWNRIPALRWGVCATSFVAAILSMAMGVQIGAYRGIAVTEHQPAAEMLMMPAVEVFSGDGAALTAPARDASPVTQPEPTPLPAWAANLETVLPLRIGMLLMGLTMMAAFAGEWAFRPVMMYTVSIAGRILALLLWPIRLVLGILHELLDVVAQIVESFIDLVHLTGTGAPDGRSPALNPDALQDGWNAAAPPVVRSNGGSNS